MRVSYKQNLHVKSSTIPTFPEPAIKITQILFNDSHIRGEHLQLPPLTVKQWPPVVLLRSGERCLPIASTPMWK